MTPYEPAAPYAIRQFEIDRLIPIDVLGLDASFTNSAQAMVTTVIAVSAFMLLASRRGTEIPGRMQAAAEMVYEFVARTVVETAGLTAARHIPFIFSLFVFILFGSLIGLTPFKFTFTSHLAVTIGLALIAFVYVTGVALARQGWGFFASFIPPGTPLALAPLIAFIEALSYVFRPVTLGVRLFANVLAGHVIIKLFADFSAMMVEALGPIGFLPAVLPALMNVVFFGFEVVVFMIQSYIFVLLTCVYLRSAEEAHA